jgi:putative tryptophan/tyrosine transport system substrate-binding protein
LGTPGWDGAKTVDIVRRKLIAGLGDAALWPLAARAQQANRMRRIGVLMAYSEGSSKAQSWIASFRDGLGKLGWAQNDNIHINYRWATPDSQLIDQSARELVGMQPDLIISSASPTTAALLQQTHTIPVIFMNLVDPVCRGFIASLSRSGGNVTGFINLEAAVTGKYIELLEEIAPRHTRSAMYFNPATTPFAQIYLESGQCRG